MNSGGMAFPSEGQKYETGLGMRHYSEPGMTLRDYFAAKAMQAMLSGGDYDKPLLAFSVDAYEMADAMIRAREER